MYLSKQAINKLIELYQKHYGEELSYEEAEESGMASVSYTHLTLPTN